MSDEITLGYLTQKLEAYYDPVERLVQNNSPEVLAGLAVVVGLLWTANSWMKGIREYDESIDDMVGR